MIEVVQGDDKDISFALTDSSGVAVNLTGATLFVTVKRYVTDLDAAAVISGTLTVAVPASGIGVWSLVPANTLNLLGVYYMDIQYKTAAGKIYTVKRDTFIVNPHITIRTV